MHLQQNIDLIAGTEGAGPWRAFGDFFQATVQVVGADASIQLEASNDPLEITNIADWGEPLTEGIHKIECGPRWIRVADQSGADSAILNGRG